MHRIAVLLAVLPFTVAAPLLAPAAQSIDLPARKPGQWEMKVTTEKPVGGWNISAKMCIDAATDRELMDFGLRMSKDSCKRYDMKRAGATWVIDAECAFGPVKSATKTTISGDFQSAVTVRTEGTTEGIPGVAKGPQPTLMTQTARWIGTCPAELKPGDIAMDGGMKFNIKQIKQLQKLLPNIQIR
jgi:Protein of unknown function (DUF3617)